MPSFAGSVTSYRLRCDCGAETVVRDRDLEATDWAVTSLHYHEGECPQCRGISAETPTTDGDNATLTAYATDGGQR